MAVSTPVTILSENIPEALQTGKRFVAYRRELRKGQPKPAKMPYSPIMENPREGASSTDPAHWTTFDQAVKYAQAAGLDGVMRAFEQSDGMVGIDLDNCLDPNIPDPSIDDLAAWAANFVRRLDTYTEISPSGTGVKLWVYATMPPFGHKRGDVEMYGSTTAEAAAPNGACGRFFAITGRWLDWTPREVKYRPDAILAIHREVFGDAPDVTAAGDGDLDRPIPALEIGDEDVLRLASESQHNGEKFRRLWSGDTSGYAMDDNDGTSEADAALCELIAYYGGPDRERIERLWLRSGLGAREKVQRADYRKRTIDLALRGKTRFYGDSLQAPAATGSDGADGCACETCPARVRVTFLERALLDRDDLVESQQTIIRTQRSELEDKTAFLTHVTNVLAKPNEEMSSTQKVVGLALAYETHYRAARGRTKLPLIALVERTGLSKNTVSTASRAICDREGSPFDRSVTREIRRSEDGNEQFVTTIEFRPRTERTADTLRAIASLPAVPDKLKHGGSQAAAAARWGRCDQHDNTEVRIKGYCPGCGHVVGEGIVSRKEFEALNHQVCVSEAPGPTVAVVLSSNQVGDSDAPPLNLLDYAASRPQEEAPAAPGAEVSGPRCGATKSNGRECISTMYREQGGGRLRCLGCGAVGTEALSWAIVAGGSE